MAKARMTVIEFAKRRLWAEFRLISAVLIGIVAWTLLPSGPGTTRLLIAWNIGCWLYIALALGMMARAEIEDIRRRSDLEEEGTVAATTVPVVASLIMMIAIGAELTSAQDLGGSERAWSLILVLATIFGSWLLVHMVFTLYYAHEYHRESDRRGGGARAGLKFPNERTPDYWDFLYFGLVVGTTAQTSDVEVSSRPMRRIVMIHGLLSFILNTTVIAFTVSMAAQLFQG